MAPIERLMPADSEPGTIAHVSPPSVDLYRPRPASESPEPFGSPEPAYSVLPVESVGSTISEPKALVFSPSSIGVQVGLVSSAFSVRQIPPPAAATQRRQPSPSVPQLGSIASAVTRPDSCVGGPVWLSRSKNCEAS